MEKFSYELYCLIACIYLCCLNRQFMLSFNVEYCVFVGGRFTD